MIEIRTVTDLKEAEFFWRALSPNQTIFDEWDFRYCFYKHAPLPLKFLVAMEKGESGREEPVALLPLQFNADWGGLEFFAEDPCEQNRLFIRPGYDRIIPELYAAIPSTAKFYDISGQDEFTRSLPIEDYTYFLPLSGLSGWSDYLRARLSPKQQRNFRSDRRKVEAYSPQVFYGRHSDLSALFELNSASFSDSYLQSAPDRQGWQDLLDLPYDWQIVGIEVAGRVQAASLSVLYKQTYFYLINGTNLGAVPGLGKYLNLINLERAFALGANRWEAGLGDCNWKLLWHCDREPQYEFIKP